MLSNILREDIERAISDPNISWQDMYGASVLITGATGLIGSMLVHVLAAANQTYGLKLRLIGHGRNRVKGKALGQAYGIEFITSDIGEVIPRTELPPGIDYIFHGAAITKSSDMLAKPVDVIHTAVSGTKNVLDLAVERNCKSLIYLSSMEVYGQTEFAEVSENHLGYLDLSNPRSSYPASKRMCETLCAAYAKQYGLPVKIARLAQTFGAGAPQDDPRVFAQFARSAFSGKDIVLHTEGKSRGNYCYTTDAVRAILLLLVKGENSQVYNVANPDASMTVREMAELVAQRVGNIQVKAIISCDTLKLAYAPDSAYILNIDKIKNIGWKAEYSLADMYERLIADWRERVYKQE